MRAPVSRMEPGPDCSFTAVSLNVAKERDADRILAAIRDAHRLRDADIFLLQEVRHEPAGLSVAERLANKLGFHVSFAEAAPEVFDQGLALVSRYPLTEVEVRPLKQCNLRFRSRTRFAMAANMQTPWGKARVWNLHLDTRINEGERLNQLQPVLDDAAGHAGPRLIGGDFNTNDLYWLGNSIPLPFGPAHGVALRKTMQQHGFETPLPGGLETFRPFRRHLDWIFVSDLAPVEASVEHVPFSDHNAIWIRVRM